MDEARKHIRVPTMAVGLRKKIDQNPILREKLMKTKGRLYEAMRTNCWGAGFVILQAANMSEDTVTGDNMLGKELTKLKRRIYQ